MRLSSTLSGRFLRFRADSDAFWTTQPTSPRNRPRLRRILDHQEWQTAGTTVRGKRQRSRGALMGHPLPAGGRNGAHKRAGRDIGRGRRSRWRGFLPGYAHKGGNYATRRRTQRRDQALVCGQCFLIRGPCVRTREVVRAPGKEGTGSTRGDREARRRSLGPGRQGAPDTGAASVPADGEPPAPVQTLVLARPSEAPGPARTPKPPVRPRCPRAQSPPPAPPPRRQGPGPSGRRRRTGRTRPTSRRPARRARAGPGPP